MSEKRSFYADPPGGAGRSVRGPALVLQIVVGNLLIALIDRGALDAETATEMLLGARQGYQDAAGHQRPDHPESAAMWSATSRGVIGNLLAAVRRRTAQKGGAGYGAPAADDRRAARALRRRPAARGGGEGARRGRRHGAALAPDALRRGDDWKAARDGIALPPVGVPAALAAVGRLEAQLGDGLATVHRDMLELATLGAPSSTGCRHDRGPRGGAQARAALWVRCGDPRRSGRHFDGFGRMSATAIENSARPARRGRGRRSGRDRRRAREHQTRLASMGVHIGAGEAVRQVLDGSAVA